MNSLSNIKADVRKGVTEMTYTTNQIRKLASRACKSKTKNTTKSKKK